MDIPPLLLHNGGEPFAVERLASTSTVIGLFPALECNVVEKQFAPGDTLIVYSDGLTEAENMEGEPFGENRLLEIACSHCQSQHPSF